MPFENHYAAIDLTVWNGRIDDEHDRKAFRLHQVIQKLDLDHIDTFTFEPNTQKFAILGFCSDEGIRRNLGRVGAVHAPGSIRKQLANLPVTFDNSVTLFDAGNIHCSNQDLENTQTALAWAIQRLLAHDVFPLVIGGGHEIVWGHYQGIYAHLQITSAPSVGIINFDAHFDLRPVVTEANSGTPFSQIAVFCESNQLDFGYQCIGIQQFGNTQSLFDKADKLNVSYLFANKLLPENKAHYQQTVTNFIKKHQHIYITLDADVFNAAYAPGVSATQPLGITPDLVCELLELIIHSGKVISFDIAEVSPPLDVDNRTSKLAAFMVYQIVNFLIAT